MQRLAERAAISPFGKRGLGLLCGLAAAAIWGGGAVVSRHLVTSGLGPADLTLLRYIGCFPVALVMLLATGDRLWLGISLPRLTVLLILGGPIYHAIVVAGYQYVSAGGGALLLSGLLPLFALGLSGLTGWTAPSRAKLAGTVAVLAGLAWFGRGAGASFSLAGVGLFALAAAAWAALNEAVRHWQVDPLRLTVALALFAPAFAPLYLLTGSGQVFNSPPDDLLLQLAYHGWLVAIGATSLFLAAVRLAGAQIAAVLQASSPGFSAVSGAALLNEPLMPAQIGGLVLVTAGVLLFISGSYPGPARRSCIARWVFGRREFVLELIPRPRSSRWP